MSDITPCGCAAAGAGRTHHESETPVTAVLPFDDGLLVNYVLGVLAEDDREPIDRASIENDAVAARLRIVEQDLVDGYVRRTLPADTMKRFEAYYLTTARRRQRVLRAETFLRGVDRAAARTDAALAAHRTSATGVSEEEPADVWITARPTRGRSLLVWAAPLAAAAILATAVGLLVRTAPSVPRPGQADRGAIAARGDRTPAPTPPSSSLATDRTGSSPAARDVVTSTPASVEREAAEPMPAIALVLPPQTRAIAEVPILAGDAIDQRVAVTLQIESAELRDYQVALKDPAAGRLVWRSSWTRSRGSVDDRSVQVVLPAGVLQARRYWLELTGRTPGGREELVGTYVFQVATP